MSDVTKKEAIEAGASEETIKDLEIKWLWEIVDSLPVYPHDMEVHFWCDHPWDE